MPGFPFWTCSGHKPAFWGCRLIAGELIGDLRRRSVRAIRCNRENFDLLLGTANGPLVITGGGSKQELLTTTQLEGSNDQHENFDSSDRVLDVSGRWK